MNAKLFNGFSHYLIYKKVGYKMYEINDELKEKAINEIINYKKVTWRDWDKVITELPYIDTWFEDYS